MPAASWLLVSVSSNVVRLRRVNDASVVDEWLLPDTDGSDVQYLQMSRWSRMGAAVDRARNRLAFLALTERRCQWQSLPPCDHPRVIDVTADGVAVAVESSMPAGELTRAIYARGVSESLPLGLEVAALEAHASEFLIADATSPTRLHLRRVRIDAGGRFEIRDEAEFDPGESHPLLLGLVDLGDGRFVTQMFEGIGPPWIVVIEPGHPPLRIMRSWFDSDQAIVREGVLLHFPGFGSRRLLRLELREGATPTPAFGDSKRFRSVEALSPDGRLALSYGDEIEMVGTSDAVRIYHLLDITSGTTQSRLAIPHGEQVSSWLVG
jgi:hypothetical protein